MRPMPAAVARAALAGESLAVAAGGQAVAACRNGFGCIIAQGPAPGSVLPSCSGCCDYQLLWQRWKFVASLSAVDVLLEVPVDPEEAAEVRREDLERWQWGGGGEGQLGLEP
jgi:hypothetical protein